MPSPPISNQQTVKKVGDLRVARQEQPHGEAGVRFSLRKVAQKIAEGRIHPDVRSWTTKVLAAVGNPKGPRYRAAAILEAIRKQSGWVPDPTASEFIAGAHLTLGDGTKPPFFALGDCDDLTVAFGSAVLAPVMYLAAAESVGAQAAVVGHAYGPDKMIEHVLGAIYDEGKWWYADPSLKDMPFGQCKPFTRERVYQVPSLELLCDASVCLTEKGIASGPPPAPRRGDFVGVDGTREIDQPSTLLDVCDTSGVCMLGAAGFSTTAYQPTASSQSAAVPPVRRASSGMPGYAAPPSASAPPGGGGPPSSSAPPGGGFPPSAGGPGGPPGPPLRRMPPQGPPPSGDGPPEAPPMITQPGTPIPACPPGDEECRLYRLAQFTFWADATPCDQPLDWQYPWVDPRTDYAGQEMYTPWNDGEMPCNTLEEVTGAGWLIRNSAFIPPR